MPSANPIRLSLLGLFSLLLASGTAAAQPIATNLRTVEARVARADHVVVATIDKVSQGKIDNARGTPLGGPYKVTVTLRVVEVLKGDLVATVDDLRAKHAWHADDRYWEWSRAGTTLLCFLGPTPGAGERREWDFIPVGQQVPAEERMGEPRGHPPLFSMDLTLLKGGADVLGRARAFAKAWPTVRAIHTIEIPPVLNPRSSGAWDYLIVPVEPTLEPRAKRLVASPEAFLPEKARGEQRPREMLRLAGVSALRHFKSDANADLLRAILSSADESVALRTMACVVLSHWDADVPMSEPARAITDLDLRGTRVTDAGLKRLAGLSNLTTLRLEDTKVTAEGLRALAALKRLESLGLDDEQFTDAHLRVLCDVNLMHRLTGQVAGSSESPRPQSIEGILTLALPRSAVTDVGLRELARFTNLARLDLRETRVTDAGLKELEGLKSLTVVQLEGTRVTEAGVAAMRKALPRCEIRSGPIVPPAP